MSKLKKIDLLLAIIIGEAAALLMLLIGNNLALENQAIAGIVPYLKYLPVVFPVLCVAGLVVAYLLSRIITPLYQFAKFFLVGGLNFLIDLGVLNFLVFFTSIAAGATQSLFKATAFLVAVINSYFWNKHWVFKRKTEEKVPKEFTQFLLVSIVGFLINVGVNYLFVNYIQSFWGLRPRTWAQMSAMFAAIAALFWNFVGYKFIVFDVKKEVVQTSVKIAENTNDKNSAIS